VCKTTLSSLLAWVCAAEGPTGLAVDVNPDTNLTTALGMSAEEVMKIVPISEMGSLIEEHIGAKLGSSSPFFKLNPTVYDIPDSYCINLGGG
jgi:CO dehydrogenase maturation factor